LSVLIPVRNEGINLAIMLKMLKAMVEVPHEVLVVYDDAADDDVPVIAALRESYPHLRGVHNRLGRGVVRAIEAGVAEAHGEYVLIFAADEVGPVLAIDHMLSLVKDGCDFVSCTRYAHGGRRLGGSWIGGILSRVANALFYVVSSSALTDVTTGIKMFRRAVFDQLKPQANPVGWAVAFELGIKAQLLGLKLGEVPIISIDRLYGGKSSFRPGPWCVEYLRWFFWGAIQLRRLRGGKRPPVRICDPRRSLPR